VPIRYKLIVATTIVLLLVAGCGEPVPTAMPPTAATSVRPSATPIPPTGVSTSLPIPQPGGKYQKPGDYTIEIESFGAERTFILHVPPGYQHGIPAPLVFNLHGYNSTAYQQRNQSHMNVKADREGFIVVYPQALQTPPIWVGFMPGPAGYADVRFFQDMIVYLQQEMSIDPARIYATGISNGAVMVNHLGCVMSDTFAAIALVAGNHIGYDICEVEHPISVMALHGTADRVAPYDGGGSGVPPVHIWVEAWAQRNGCHPEPNTNDLNPQVKEETWIRCTEDVVVTLYTIEGGEHEWPGTAFGPGPYPEDLAPAIYATDVIWDFFQAHPKVLAP
jgi:polyhydroxybutyrate depolymerase